MASAFDDLAAKSSSGVLSLAGVLVGLWAYLAGAVAWLALAAIGLAAWVALVDGRDRLPRQPIPASWEIELWLAAPIVITAIATGLAIEALLRIDLTPLLAGRGLAADQIKEVTGVVKGAASGFLAFAFTKDIGEGAGAFSVAVQFKAAMSDASGELPVNPPPDPIPDVLESDDVPGGPSGWGFAARRERAQRLSDYLGSLARAP